MLTATGRWTAGCTALLLGAGWVLGYGELLVLGLGGAAALLQAAVWMIARPHVLVVREIRPVRVREGEECHGVLTVTNRSPRRSPPVVAVEQVGGRPVSIPVPSLARGAARSVEYLLPTDRRGVHQVGPLTIGHADPLRLLSAARPVATQSVLTVHPAWHPVPPLPLGRSRNLDGPTTEAAPQGGIAFHSLREYRAGDDRRLIHWRSSARTGTLMVRHLVVPTEPRMVVLLDTLSLAYVKDGFEDAVRIAASLAVSLATGGFPLDLRTTGGQRETAEPGTGDGRRALDLLAAVRATPDDSGLQVLAGLDVVGPDDDGVALTVVTGSAAGAGVQVLPAVRARFELITLVQVGPRVAAAPAGAFPGARPGAFPGATDGALRGVVTVTVADAAEFTAAWVKVASR